MLKADDAVEGISIDRLCPEMAEYFEHAGDLALMAQHTWLDLLSDTDLFLRETVERKLGEMRIELAGADPSPLEKLLVERVVACWLQINHTDTIFAGNQSSSESVRKELLKRQESAQHRYVYAIKQLAQLRKLVAPKARAVRVKASEDPVIATAAAPFPRITRVI